MKKHVNRLAPGFFLFLTASLPAQCSAETVSGSWRGTLIQTVEYFVNGEVEGPTTSTSPFTLTVTWDSTDGFLSFNVAAYIEPDITSDDPFGPNSVSLGDELFAGGPVGFTEDYSFGATYTGINSEGEIIGGSAAGDFTYVGAIPGFGYGSYLSIFDSFQTGSVPEPPTIVPMGFGLLGLLIFAGRKHVAIRPSRPQRTPRAERG